MGIKKAIVFLMSLMIFPGLSMGQDLNNSCKGSLSFLNIEINLCPNEETDTPHFEEEGEGSAHFEEDDEDDDAFFHEDEEEGDAHFEEEGGSSHFLG